MRRLTVAFICAAMVLGSGQAMAQDGETETPAETEDLKTRFYIFDGKTLEGGVLSPGGVMIGARRGVAFDPLLVLSRSFLERIPDTARELK